MEGQAPVSAPAPQAQVVSTASTNDSKPISTKEASAYKVSQEDLKDMGVDLGDDSEGDGDFEFGAVATPKVGDEEIQDGESDGVNLKDSDESTEEGNDEWLDAIKKDLDIDESPDQVQEGEPQDPLELKEVEIERYGIKQKIPFKEAIKLAQQGYDYTQKTQALSEEKKEFEKTRDQMLASLNHKEAQIQETLNQKEQLDYFFDYLQNSKPDAFQELQQEFQSFKHQISNPFLEKHMQSQKKEVQELKQLLQKEQESKIRESYTRELEELKAMHFSKYAKLGLKMDENTIRDEWVKTGEPLKNIYKKFYADKILSLAQSKGALSKKVKAASNKAPTAGRVKAPTSPKSDIGKAFKKMSYSQIADAVMKGNVR